MNAESAAAAPGTSGVGAQLASARVARNYSVNDVARQLKLSAGQIEALEADDYARLPRGVFVRGFIRNYARLVGLDPESLVSAAEPQLPQAAPRSEQPSPDIPYPSRRRVPWGRYALAAGLVFAAFGGFELYYWADNEGMMRVHQEPLKVAPVVVPMETPASTPATPDAAATPPAVPEAAPAPAAQAAATGQPAPAAENPVSGTDAPAKPAPAVKVAATGSTYELTLNFERESWVEVRDAHGQRIFSQLNAAGTRQTVSGERPLSLIIGNANGVRLQVNGAPLELGPYITVDVARLTLQ